MCLSICTVSLEPSLLAYTDKVIPGLVTQLEGSLTGGRSVTILSATKSHTFLEIGHEIISTVIILLPQILGGMLSHTRESMCTKC